MLPCPYAKKCGGCSLQNLPYEEQLHLKQAKLIGLLGRFGRVEEIIGMDDPTHYRGKIQAAFKSKSGKVISGVYQSASRRIVEVEDCMLEDACAAPILATIRKLCASMKIKPYDLESGQGFLRHVLIRKGFVSGEIMVVLVTAKGEFRSERSFVNELIRRHPEITTVVRNINPTDTALFLGNESHVLHGEGFITDRLCGLDFRISPRSFYQVNPVQTEILYGKAKEFAALTGKETVIDAYCGTGTIGLTMASSAKAIIGVEVNRDAVTDAMDNARRNGIANATFHAADAGQFMEAMAAKGQTADVVVTDPPRAGCSGKFLHSLLKLAPARVVYVSCNPETLARDLFTLTKGGYKVKKIQPVDMFPWTGHVETVCLLSKLNAKQHIEINLNMDELDLTDAEKKATYQEIKDYVLEHSGLKVSSLYIAQVKQKCGIIERENYNKPKSEDAKQPQCPPDKEKAIKEALQHFGML
ncbi:MAG: 23S rRNA (uracil(1939)-C(5))-methyltransferase RlmD [Ruminococcaceae bacterium]|nr:23S rRNA (uracil(1939)-C(5))-methyltransferase RlmD [Oscillospiraceae bacterium]